MPSLETEILLLPPSLTIQSSRLLAFKRLFLSDPSCVLYPMEIRFSLILVAALVKLKLLYEFATHFPAFGTLPRTDLLVICEAFSGPLSPVGRTGKKESIFSHPRRHSSSYSRSYSSESLEFPFSDGWLVHIQLHFGRYRVKFTTSFHTNLPSNFKTLSLFIRTCIRS